MVAYMSGRPPINFDEDGLLYALDGDAIRTALHVATDPVTGVAIVSVYHDDGFGNGNCILALPLVELRALVKNYTNAQEKES
ncbi:MAG: hypothetical protein KGL39_21835 [Patescibacteria group bacterium]|nr:hypothetical protein [Patescibacteria group bacterium]